MSNLAASLTIRLSSAELRRLRVRARAAGTTPSAVVRSLVEADLAEATDDMAALGERTSRWIGAVHDARVPAGRDARKALRAWKPDRRG